MKKILLKYLDCELKAVKPAEDIKYKIYWVLEKHCEEAVPILQVDRKIAWKCKHIVV